MLHRWPALWLHAPQRAPACNPTAPAPCGPHAPCTGGGGAHPQGVAVQRALLTLEMEVGQIMKGGFDHFMQARGQNKAWAQGSGLWVLFLAE